jgi:putative protease
LPIHLSTQASCLNSATASLWKKAGVTRLVLGRETSIEEAGKIKRETGLEVELFIHGSMCMAYSGHCVISNYTQGRDSNRGGCSHSCRHDYEVTDEQGNKKNSFFMSSKDLRGLELLPYFSQYEIDSLKIEGRMKGPLYAANSTRTYRQALDLLRAGEWSPDLAAQLEQELEKMAHRSYTSASLSKPANFESVYHDRETEFSDYECSGVVIGETERDLLIEVRAKFFSGDELELLPFRGPKLILSAEDLRDFRNQPLDSTRPGYVVRVRRPIAAEMPEQFTGQILRRHSPETTAQVSI